VDFKQCSKCKEKKPFDEFDLSKAMKSGRASYCKLCTKKAVRKSRESDPECKKKNAAYCKAYRITERGRSIIKAYRSTEEYKTKSALRAKNYMSSEEAKKKVRERQRRYEKEQPDWLIRKRLADHQLFSSSDIPQELVDAKRIEIKIKRNIKAKKCKI